MEAQTEQASQIVVVIRTDDLETASLLSDISKFNLPLEIVPTESSGQVAALNSGLQRVHGEIVCFTDDDAAPRPDWLARIWRHYESQPEVGGVGGRDFMQDEVGQSEQKVVGKIQWFGRTIGNHHRGAGRAREVDVLKGANMSFRRCALAGLSFDARLRGTGAQVHNDMAISLAVKRRGWKLIYDPMVSVDHYPGPRYDEDARCKRQWSALENQAYNETLVLLEHFRIWQRLTYVVWALLIGTRSLPGIAQIPRLLLSERGQVMTKLVVCVRGRVKALVGRTGIPYHTGLSTRNKSR